MLNCLYCINNLVHDKCLLLCRPKWPDASFISAKELITTMAYRTPHVASFFSYTA